MCRATVQVHDVVYSVLVVATTVIFSQQQHHHQRLHYIGVYITELSRLS